MPYIEVKARKEIDLDEARKIVRKGTITAVITTGKITRGAKKLFDEHGIAWAEYISEEEFFEKEGEELD
ncbi:MAG: hypothetical protein KDK90_28100 [Leptospiraceae bacterium]|nr:hypothetical protein [Leptospiraceae bacterium]